MPPLPLSGSATRRILRLSSQPPFNNPKSPHILSTRTNHIRTIHNLGPPHCPLYALSPSTPRQNPPKARTFTTTPPPPSSSPSPPQTAQSAQQPSILPIEKFHTLADTYIDNLVLHLEQLQEEREDVDVEYSAGVLTLQFPPAGTYVLNKQPPNRQIWLSSPLSGPKRYDWVEYEGGGGGGDGEWTYLRDGGLLSELLEGELGIRLREGV